MSLYHHRQLLLRLLGVLVVRSGGSEGARSECGEEAGTPPPGDCGAYEQARNSPTYRL